MVSCGNYASLLRFPVMGSSAAYINYSCKTSGYNRASSKFSMRKFGAQHIYMLDLRCFGEQGGGISHKRSGDRADEMRGRSCFVGKFIENVKRGRLQTLETSQGFAQWRD
jgi:hypothetical protein